MGASYSQPITHFTMLNYPGAAILQTYVGPYGRLTATGQCRLIRILELMQRMTPDQLAIALAEIRELNVED